MDLNIYYIACVDIKLQWSVNSVNPLYLMINRVDCVVNEKNGVKYLKICDTERNSKVLKKYNEVFYSIKDCIKKIDNSDSEYDENYMRRNI